MYSSESGAALPLLYTFTSALWLGRTVELCAQIVRRKSRAITLRVISSCFKLKALFFSAGVCFYQQVSCIATACGAHTRTQAKKSSLVWLISRGDVEN